MDASMVNEASAHSWQWDLFRVFLIAFLVILNGFFVAAEFAIVKVRSTTIRAMAEDGNRRARMAQGILAHLDAYLSATQLGITIASIMLGAIGEKFMTEQVVEPLLGTLPFMTESATTAVGFFLGTGIIVFLHVVLGELAPKSLAIQRPNATTLWVSYPLHWFYVVLYPAIAVLNGAANAMLRLVGIQPAMGHEIAHSEEELRMIVLESQRIGHITRDKLDLLENVFDFSDVTVRQIMVPRVEVAVFDLRKSLGDNLAVAERTAHSRYPLIDGDLDHVSGIIHMKDLFWQLKELEMSPQEAAAAVERRHPLIAGGDLNKKPPASGADFLTTIARPVLYVPETAKINTLLHEFQTKRIHMAMVVDEYGSTTGLVTFENIIEEIVGEVQDEFDQETPRIQKLAEHEYMVDGVTALDDINDELGLELESEDADTIGGYVLSEMGRFPKPGDRIVVPPLELTVRELRRQRIHRVLVRVLTEEEQENLQPVEPESTDSDDTLY
jgi:CBS domain containing-hemolysin-like protein